MVKPWKRLGDAMKESYERIVDRRDGKIKSLKTKWKQFNKIGLNGVEWQSLVIIATRPGTGKALCLNTKIPTPYGFTTMGELKVGDEILGNDGLATKVTFITETMHNRKCYELEFCDGTKVTADAEHLWYTETRAYRKSANQQRWRDEHTFIKTTQEIKDTFLVGSDNRLNHSIPLTKPCQFDKKELPIEPYILGYWLGNGSSTQPELYVGKHLADDLIIELDKSKYYYNIKDTKSCYKIRISDLEIKKESRVNNIINNLRTLNLINNKHIPKEYLRASEQQRRDLLAGLLDSDGYCSKKGYIQFSVVAKELAYGFKELVSSLGYKPTIITKKVKGRNESTSTCYIVGFKTCDNVFRVKFRADRINDYSRANTYHRFITSIKEVDSVPVKCITVDNKDHMYLITDAFIPTHNTLAISTLTRDMQECNKDQIFNVLHFQFEMLATSLCTRELSAGTELNVRYIQSAEDDGMPKLTLEDLNRLREYAREQSNRNEFIVDRPMTVKQMKDTMVKFYEETLQPFIVTLDHTLLIQQDASENTKQNTLENFAIMCTYMKNHYPVLFIIASQLNREIDDAERQKPGQLSNFPTDKDVYGSDYTFQCADVVIAYNRPAKYNLSVYGPLKYHITPDDKFLLACHILKNRFGELGIHWYRADYPTMRIEEAEEPSKKANFNV